MPKRLAVVIASYNHAKYIPFAIESVLGQTRPPDRFVIIDDGSPDNSVEVIRPYERDGSVELLVQENAGAHATWNRCIETASEDCELISILNSDDIYHRERFEHCLPLFDADGGKAVVSSSLRMIDPENDPLPADDPRAKWLRAATALGTAENMTPWEWLAMANFLMTSSNIIARADYLKANPFRPYQFNHDYFFLAGAALRDQIALVDQVLLDYRVHPENNINTEPAPLLKEMLRMHLDLYHSFSGEFESNPAVRQRFYQYMAAAQDSISSFHAGIFQLLLTQLAARTGFDELEQMIDDLDPDSITELNDYPNKALVNQWDGSSPPQLALGIAGKLEEARSAKSKAEADRKALRELGQLRRELLASKSFALARLFGGGKSLLRDAGKTPQEKLEHLRRAIDASPWARRGR